MDLEKLSDRQLKYVLKELDQHRYKIISMLEKRSKDAIKREENFINLYMITEQFIKEYKEKGFEILVDSNKIIVKKGLFNGYITAIDTNLKENKDFDVKTLEKIQSYLFEAP